MDIATLRKVVEEYAPIGLKEIISFPFSPSRSSSPSPLFSSLLLFYLLSSPPLFFDEVYIPSTMGEPLMYKHFPEIIEICRTNNVRMNLTTNGTFLGRGVHEVSKEEREREGGRGREGEEGEGRESEVRREREGEVLTYM